MLLLTWCCTCKPWHYSYLWFLMGRNCHQSKNDSFLPLALPHPFFYNLKFILKEKHKLVNNIAANRDLKLQFDFNIYPSSLWNAWAHSEHRVLGRSIQKGIWIGHKERHMVTLQKHGGKLSSLASPGEDHQKIPSLEILLHLFLAIHRWKLLLSLFSFFLSFVFFQTVTLEWVCAISYRFHG